MEVQRRYGEATTIYFPLIQDGSQDYATNAEYTPQLGDCQIIKDGGAPANTTNLPSHVALGQWELDLTAAEMTAAYINIVIVDSEPKAIADQGILIATYGAVGAASLLPPAPGLIPVGGDSISLAAPLTRAHLSLSRYARIMGLNPVHFSCAYSDTVWPLLDNRANDIWCRHSWQTADQTSLEEVADAIRDAENSIAQHLNAPVAPEFVVENIPYPKIYDPLMSGYGFTATGGMKSVKAKYGHVTPGRRGTTFIQTATTDDSSLQYYDADVDGFYETAILTITTTVTDANELHVFFYNTEADERWEIRHPRSISISGGVAVLTFDSWLFIHPDEQAGYPTVNGWMPVNLNDTSPLVSKVDVYRVFVDNTSTQSRFIWSNGTTCQTCSGTGCSVCSTPYQDGCLDARNPGAGILVPIPATYSDGWVYATWSYSKEPTNVWVWYMAGKASEDYLLGKTHDPLSQYLAEAITYIATARLMRPFTQSSLLDRIRKLQMDANLIADGRLFSLTPEDYKSPFGMKVGEIMAWRRLRSYNERIVMGAAL